MAAGCVTRYQHLETSIQRAPLHHHSSGGRSRALSCPFFSRGHFLSSAAGTAPVHAHYQVTATLGLKTFPSCPFTKLAHGEGRNFVGFFFFKLHRCKRMSVIKAAVAVQPRPHCSDCQRKTENFNLRNWSVHTAYFWCCKTLQEK